MSKSFKHSCKHSNSSRATRISRNRGPRTPNDQGVVDAEEEVEIEVEAQRSYKLERNAETAHVCVISDIHPGCVRPEWVMTAARFYTYDQNPAEVMRLSPTSQPPATKN